jgi:dolichol-phosphate mannosyltransferase
VQKVHPLAALRHLDASDLLRKQSAPLFHGLADELDQAAGVERDAGEGPGVLLRRLLAFNAICGLGIGLSVLLLNLFYRCFGFNLYLANLLAIFLVTLWNFGLNLKFNWADQSRRFL